MSVESFSEQTIIFGGSFNPPTLAHEAIIAACLERPQFKDNEIWLMPSGERLDKKIGTSDKERLAMLELIKHERFGDNPRLQVSDLELRLQRPTQAYRTVAALAEEHKNTRFWFVLGADSYSSMPTWAHGKELMKDLSIILFGRGGELQIDSKNKRIISLKVPGCENISSSQARLAIRTGEPTKTLVSEPIRQYIVEHQLYHKSSLR
jgi:nicotinate-nucleotide adenylyltransferase